MRRSRRPGGVGLQRLRTVCGNMPLECISGAQGSVVAAGEADAENDNKPSRERPAAGRALERPGLGVAQEVPIKMFLASEYRRTVIALQLSCLVCHMEGRWPRTPYRAQE
jgi:hypothetical protein